MNFGLNKDPSFRSTQNRFEPSFDENAKLGFLSLWMGSWKEEEERDVLSKPGMGGFRFFFRFCSRNRGGQESLLDSLDSLLIL